LTDYAFNGTGQLVKKAFPTPQAKLAPGRDRFGRVTDQRWTTDAGVTRDRFRHAYDAAGNRVWREVMDNAAFGGAYYSEHYTYDGLNRLVDTKRGQLTGTPYTAIAGTPSRQETFGLNQLGNWKNYGVLAGGSATLTQTRTHDGANEITGITNTVGPAWTAPTYDNAGNMTTGIGGTNQTYIYDAWNRLVKTKSGAVTTSVYQYDGLHRQISRLVPNGSNFDRTDYYYNEDWQVLEERTGTVANAATAASTPYVQWVWDTQYIDTPICRFRDTTGNGTLNETLYYCTDANMNVTALLDTSGNVVERAVYDAYGKPTFYAGGTFATPSATSAYANEVLFAGYRYDATLGVYEVRYRVYDPVTGRWIQRDPGGDIDGQNLYQYVLSNPIRLVDPTGLWGTDVHLDGTIKLAVAVGYNNLCAKIIGDANEAIDNELGATPPRPWGDMTYHFDWDAVGLMPVLNARQKNVDKHLKEAHKFMADAEKKSPWLNISKALKQMGIALHPLQDMYSHKKSHDADSPLTHAPSVYCRVLYPRGNFDDWCLDQQKNNPNWKDANRPDDTTLWATDVKLANAATTKILKAFFEYELIQCYCGAK